MTNFFGQDGEDFLSGNKGSDAFEGGPGFDRFRDTYHPSEQVACYDATDVRVGPSALANFAAALAACADSNVTLFSQVPLGSASNEFKVRMKLNTITVNVPVRFDGTWTDDDLQHPRLPNSTVNSKEFWPILFGRAFLTLNNINYEITRSSGWINPIDPNWKDTSKAFAKLTGGFSFAGTATPSISGGAQAARKRLENGAPLAATKTGILFAPSYYYVIQQSRLNDANVWMAKVYNVVTGESLELAWSVLAARCPVYFFKA